MPTLTVSLANQQTLSLSFTIENNLFQLLATHAQTRVRAACRQRGTCGLCLVRIENGAVSELSHYEHEHLPPQHITRSVRLACQVRLLGDTRVSLINPLVINALDTLAVHRAAPQADAHYAVAVDLGTTQIRMSLWHKTARQRVAAYCCFNPQAQYGTDILSRLTVANSEPELATIMSELVQNTVQQVVNTWRDQHYAIDDIVIVGNSAMLALLANQHCAALLEPSHSTQAIDCSLPLMMRIVQPVAGFVGSDLLVGLLATNLDQCAGSALLIDFGTNTEIALWHNQKLWITSVPGGPAFEGCGISCGVAAEIGAVSNIIYDAQSHSFDGTMIGTGEIKGLCGSALCDVMACLIEAGQLKKNGRFSASVTELELHLSNLNYTFFLKKRDIDIFQRAKAATGAGIQQLLCVAGASSVDLNRVCIAGAFGQFLNIAHAQAIGLLPTCPIDQVILCGNTALVGCEQLLSDTANEQRLNALRQRVVMVNMSQVTAYETAFVDNLYLQAIKDNLKP